MSIPIVRLSLERMELSILTALSEYEARLDEDIRASVEAFCTPENLRAVINRHVSQAIDNVIREEVDKFYRYGSGRKVVADAVKDRLAA